MSQPFCHLSLSFNNFPDKVLVPVEPSLINSDSLHTVVQLVIFCIVEVIMKGNWRIMHYKFGRKSGGLVEKDGSLMSELIIITG